MSSNRFRFCFSPKLVPAEVFEFQTDVANLNVGHLRRDQSIRHWAQHGRLDSIWIEIRFWNSRPHSLMNIIF